MAIFGEISKKPIGIEDEKKHYESVRMQMGRVQLDSDWNEAFDLLVNSREGVLKDIIGRYGSPNDGFRTDKVLILDHLDSKKGWTGSGTGEWGIEHFEKVEGKGSFRISGNKEVERRLPQAIKNLSAQDPKLKLMFKVSAIEGATIELSVKSATTSVSSTMTQPNQYVCSDSWREIELDLKDTDLTGYETISINVRTEGVVYLDCLMFDPGNIDDGSKEFYIQGGEGADNGAGRYYVDGLVSVREGFETYLTQKDYPEAPAIEWQNNNNKKLVYLDVWKRTITGVEDPEILEPALGGPDTCTREQIVSQVKVIDSGDGCSVDLEKLRRPGRAAALTAKLSPKSEQDKCDFRPELDYTGLNNSLYRIEIHKVDNTAAASFKWSRNNGSDLKAVVRFGSDDTSVIVPDGRGLCCGDWVELCDDVSDLADFSMSDKHGKIAKISAIDPVDNGMKVVLDFSSSGLGLADRSTAPFKDRDPKLRHPKLRKWHGVEPVKDFMEMDAGVPVKELEHGIRIAFTDDNFYHGDFWQFGARVNTRAIEELDRTPPMGPVHHYAPLSIMENGTTGISYKDCRKTFPPLTALTASDIAFDPGHCKNADANGVENVQQAIEALCLKACCSETVASGESIKEAVDRIGPEGGSICLLPGVHIVTDTVVIENRKNITFRGNGTATKVVFNGTSGGDLFRVKGSQDIAFDGILMFSNVADSVIFVEDCDSVYISDCHILNLSGSSGAAEERIGSLATAVRLVDCCRLTLKENRIAAKTGVFQHGGGDAAKTPLISGLYCIGNSISAQQAGLVLLECAESIIEGNEVLPLVGDIEGTTVPLTTVNADCAAEVSSVWSSVIDSIVELVFGCGEEKTPEKLSGLGCGVFVLRSSSMKKNRFVATSGLHIFYSENNTVSGNSVECLQKGLYLGYGFDTRISENIFAAYGTRASAGHVMIAHANRNEAMASAPRLGERVRFHGSTADVVSLRYADRLSFAENSVKGGSGVVIGNEDDKFLQHLVVFSRFWEESLREAALITLAKRFAELAGLAPLLNLIEVLLESFYELPTVDWVEILVRSGLDQDSIPEDYQDLGKSPFVKALVGLFGYLAETTLVSRAEFKGNRFDVVEYGIRMEDCLTFGGVKVAENRFSGAEKTAILLKPHYICSNPELSGMALSCAYELILYALLRVAAFVAKLKGSFGLATNTGGTASPTEVALSMALLYGLGQNYKFFNNTGGTSTAEVLQKVIEAISGLIEQLTDEGFRRNVSDLCANDYRISWNQVRGKGNGINTNIMNIVIESNRIDVEPGRSAIAELFSTGQFVSTDEDVLYAKDGAGNLKHSVIASLGLALMDANPCELDNVIEMLSDAAGQKWKEWNGLEGLVARVISILENSSITQDACDKAKALKKAIQEKALTKEVSVEFVAAMRSHLQGYGIILENPGAHVLNNRIEATAPCGLGVSSAAFSIKGDATGKSGVLGEVERPAPGGVLMTADAGKLDTVFYYLLFMEETAPKVNLGGQGTLFSGNSIQWGSAHGLSVSAVPLLTDCKIVRNEIQNHGLSGILSDSLIINLLVAGNEINNCYRNSKPADRPNLYQNTLGGLTISNAITASCSDNRISGCGSISDGWPALGAALIDCTVVSFNNNNVTGNGMDVKNPADELLYRRGGVIFIYTGSAKAPGVGAVDFTFNCNDFSNNKGQVLYFSGPSKRKILMQANDNKIRIDEQKDLTIPNIWISNCSDLLFNGNQISLPGNDATLRWIEIYGTSLVFNNNRIMGNASLSPVKLSATNKGLAIGNFLHRNLITNGSIAKDHNIF